MSKARENNKNFEARMKERMRARRIEGEKEVVRLSIKGLQHHIHQQNINAAWWDEPKFVELIREHYPEEMPVYEALLHSQKIALIHSEVSETLEGVRKDIQDDHLPHRLMEEVELADAVIRILDYAEHRGFDIGAAILEKVEYNRTRADHKKENRAKAGGKKC